MAKDKDKDNKKEKKGFLGRFFGAKKDEGSPATPGGDVAPEDAATLPPMRPRPPPASSRPKLRRSSPPSWETTPRRSRPAT